MKCIDCIDRFDDFLDGRVEADEAAELQAHLEACDACTEELDGVLDHIWHADGNSHAR